MNTFGVTASTARLLINRDKTTEEEIREFLYPDEAMLYPGTLMRNLTEAADIIEEKLSSHAKIRIIGDYDADGIMSTFILYDALQKLGAEADFYIPDRVRDGYGINEDMIVREVFLGHSGIAHEMDGGKRAAEQPERREG